MASVGDVMSFTLVGGTINPDHPVALSFPMHGEVDPSQVGIFYLKPDGKWQYQKTTVANGKATALVTHFSTYGLFTAQSVLSPVPTDTSSNVPAGTNIYLTPQTAGSSIYVTLDGTEPKSSNTGMLYNGAGIIVPDNGITVRAIATKNGMLDSPEMNYHYNALQNDNTSLGTIHVGLDSSLSMTVPVTSVNGSNYSATVSSVFYAVYVDVAAADPTSQVIVRYNDTTVTKTTPIQLFPGTNTILIIVKAANGDSKVYTLNVYRSLPTNADIALTYGNQTLQRNGNLFRLDVGAFVDHLQLGVKLTDPHALLTVTGAVYSNGIIDFPAIKYDLNYYELHVKADGPEQLFKLQIFKHPTSAELDSNQDGKVRIDDIIKLVHNSNSIFDTKDIISLLARISPSVIAQ